MNFGNSFKLQYLSLLHHLLMVCTHSYCDLQHTDPPEAMIRKHYAACILDFTDQMTRKTLPTFGPTMPPAKSNVVKLTKR